MIAHADSAHRETTPLMLAIPSGLALLGLTHETEMRTETNEDDYSTHALDSMRVKKFSRRFAATRSRVL
jgi:hypothetical protein